jgi:hypothetical protein
MGVDNIVQLASDFGPMGLMVAYLMWRELRTEKLSKDRIETDKALASSMALLTAAITGMKR